MKQVYYLIVGGCPTGLQSASFFEKVKRRYLVLDQKKRYKANLKCLLIPEGGRYS